MKKILIACFLFIATSLTAQTSTTELVSFTNAEFFGSCRFVFTRESGEELIFWDPELGAFANPENPCWIADQYQDAILQITWQMGPVNVYTEEGGSETFESPILTNIEVAE